MTEMYGLDPQDCRDLVKVLKNSAHQLEQVSAQLSQTVTRTGWQGPDSQRFRAQWPGNRTRLNQTAKQLESIAGAVLANIAEQEQASAAEDGGFLADLLDAGKDLWDDFTDGVGAVADGVTDGAASTVDDVRDGLGWLAEQLKDSPLYEAADNAAGQLSHLGSLIGGLLTGNPPSLSGLAAQLILTTGSAMQLGIATTPLGLLDFALFDDGTPYAGEPIPVGPNNDRNDLSVPSSASDIFQGTIDAYDAANVDGTRDGEVRIVTIKQPDGSSAYIVNIPGTEQWAPTGTGQARDLTSNLMLMSGQSTSAQEAIVMAMAKAGIPPDAPVMLNGHSQGGMLAVALASDPSFMNSYNVTNVMTVGSPIDGSSIDPRVNVLEVRHRDDLVPRLDLGGADTSGRLPGPTQNVGTVILDNPAGDTAQTGDFMLKGAAAGAILGPGEAAGGATLGAAASDAVTNHDYNNYRDSMADTGKYPDIASYENDPSMRPFITDDRTRVSAVDIPTGRNG